jgi:hypothetical protein
LLVALLASVAGLFGVAPTAARAATDREVTEKLTWSPILPANPKAKIYDVEQQVTISRSAPETYWALSGSVDRTAKNWAPWFTLGIRTDKASAGGLYGAQAVFSFGGFPVSNKTAGCAAIGVGFRSHDHTAATCYIPVAFAPGDTYKLMFGYDLVGGLNAYVYDVTFHSLHYVGGFASGTGKPSISHIYNTLRYQGGARCSAVPASSGQFDNPSLNTSAILPDGWLVPVPSGQTSYNAGSQHVDPCTKGAIAAGPGGVGVALGSSTAPAADLAGPLWLLPNGHRLPRVRLAFAAKWNLAHTTVSHARFIGVPSNITVELDCRGPHCPLVRIRTTSSDMLPLTTALNSHKWFPGDKVYFYITDPNPPTHKDGSPCVRCAWDPYKIVVQIRAGLPPKLVYLFHG